MRVKDETNIETTTMESVYLNQEDGPCGGIQNITLVIHKKKLNHHKQKIKTSLIRGQEQGRGRREQSTSMRQSTGKPTRNLLKRSSVPVFPISGESITIKSKVSSDTVINKSYYPFKSNFIVNAVNCTDYQQADSMNPFQNPIGKVKLRVYRCQLSTQDDSCCCSCNSDAMFEVMKSLYDCYKKKNCDNCKCILCGHLPREERKLGEMRKSGAALATVGIETERKKEKRKKGKDKKIKEKIDKTPAEKENILKELAMSGAPLPKGKTASENELIKKVRTEVGLPPEPITAAEKEKFKKAELAGIITPLEGKTAAQKENILKDQAKFGIILPEGKTPSDKALIAKVKAESIGVPSKAVAVPSMKLRKAKGAEFVTPLEGKTPSEKALIAKVKATTRTPSEGAVAVPSSKLRKAKAVGLMTPLAGKTPEERKKILTGLAKLGLPLPEAKSASEKNIIDKVRAELGLPSEPKTPSQKQKYEKAQAQGFMTPLEGKSTAQKEKILKAQAKAGIPLPKGRTPSEKALIQKIKAEAAGPVAKDKIKISKAKGIGAPALPPDKAKELDEKTAKVMKEGKGPSDECICGLLTPDKIPSEKLKAAIAAGLITPLAVKKPEQREKIMKDLAKQGLPLPEAKKASEKKIIDKVRAELGLPPEPKTPSLKHIYKKAQAQGIMTPLEGKSTAQKAKILKSQAEAGIPLPEGRTPSEKALIDKVRKSTKAISVGKIPSEKIRKGKAEGLVTPLAGKTPEQREKILKSLAKQGLPMPVAKTASEKNIIEKVRTELGLPPEPKTPSMKQKYDKAQAQGIITPLEGKSSAQKVKILKAQLEAGIPLAEGRTQSEKALIDKVRKTTKAISVGKIPSQKLRKAKTAGLLMPLAGKTPEQRETILKGLAKQGLPLPEAKTASERKIIEKVRAELGLPPEPKTPSLKQKYDKAQAQGIMTPLEGKSSAQKEKILKAQAEAGIPLPEGRTPSEKALIQKIKAEAAGPEGKEKKKISKTKGVGAPVLPPDKAKELDEKTAKNMKEGKGPSDECICGLLTPESEKGFVGKAVALLTPLASKTPEQREKTLKGLAKQGVRLPEAKTASEKKIIDKVRTELGLPPEPKTPSLKQKYEKAQAQGIMTPLEGKSTAQKVKILKSQAEAGIPLPEGRTPSEKALIDKVRKSTKAISEEKIPSGKLRPATAAGLMTPLAVKTPDQREKILKDLAKQGLPLPEVKTASEKKIIDKVRTELGLPPEPKTPSLKQKYEKAQAQGIMTPLEGKSTAQKEKILKSQAKAGIPLPEGRTSSEKALIDKVRKSTKAISVGKIPSEKFRKAKAAGLVTPLAVKTPDQREKILKDLAKQGLPLPEAKTASEKNIIDKVRTELGLPPEPKTPSMKQKYEKAQAQGFMTPLEGKSTAQKEKILKAQAEAGIPLPEGRTPSEKAVIQKIKAEAAGPVAKEKIKISKAKGMGAPALPLDKAKELDEKTAKVMKEGKGPSDECICGLLTPESERVSVGKAVAPGKISTEKFKAAKAAGLLSPLAGKTPDQKEKMLRSMAKQGLSLPEAKTASEKIILDKVRTELGLPPEPKTPALKQKYERAQAQGMMTPLEGKSTAQKVKILKSQAKAGIPLPEGRTPSEKALIDKVRKSTKAISVGKIPSEKFRKAKAAGLVTPLAVKTPDQREKILKDLAKQGLPLPEAKTTSEKNIIDKVRAELGLPPEPKTPSLKQKYEKAQAQGFMTPLKGKSTTQKEKILKAQAEAGIPLPEGRTPSEKAVIQKIQAEAAGPVAKDKIKISKAKGMGAPALPPDKAKELDEKTLKVMKEGKGPSDECICGLLTPESERVSVGKAVAAGKISSEKLKAAKAAGLLSPLAGKTPDQKEKMLRSMAKQGLSLPKAKTASEKIILDMVRTELGLPPEPKTPALKQKYERAQAQGMMTPLEGKSIAQKVKILKSQAKAGIPFPEGRTPSEKALIDKVRKSTKAISVGKIPSEKFRKAKAAGLVTPVAVKTPDQREKILKDLAKQGLPLPEAKTASEKNIIDKVRAELGLPPEPKTPSMKQKYEKAQAQGFMTPLEGKSTAQKEKILKAQAEAGIPLPKGRTPSEKALIQKIKAEAAGPVAKDKIKISKAKGIGAPALPPDKAKELDEKTAKVMKEGKGPSDECICGLLTPESERVSVGKAVAPVKIPSEKYKAAKAAGLLSPLAGKTPDQKEKILRGMAKQGLSLPEAKTASEKILLDKVRTELGLPPEPKTPSLKQKYERAQAQGVMTPLEGKSTPQKVKILKSQVEAGIPLPEGRTPSEKALIDKVRKSTKAISVGKIPSEKLRKAKAAGLVTPLAVKTPDQREKILKDLIKQGLPLPETKTASEKKIIDKVRAELGLPPEPKSPSMKQKYDKAQAQGIITPLEGKSPAQKGKILKAQAEAGISLPEGRSPSEKALIQKIKAEVAGPKAKEKMKIPKAKGVGAPALPPDKAKALDEKTAKVMKEGKGPSDECICGLLTPESKRVSFGKAVAPGKIPLEKLKAAKAAGLLTPIAGKTPEQREKILKGLAQQGLPLPEAKTASEKKSIDKVRAELGLPPEPKTPSLKKIYEKSLAKGIITPLKGKSPAQKEKIIKSQAEAGIPLPEGRTPSEKALIDRVKAETKAGISTPLEGKSPIQKEKILKDLAKSGKLLPKGKTPSEKEVIRKVTKDMGLPPEPKSPSEKERLLKAQVAGIVTPLEGKTPAQKEKILKSLAQAGVPLPEARTASEKALISKTQAELKAKPSKKPGPLLSEAAKALDEKTAKVMKEGKGPSDECICGILTPESEKFSVKAGKAPLADKPEKVPIEKLRKAKAAGLITPLKGKSPAQQEKILQGLAESGIPLPEGKTPSEKAMVQKVKTEYGIPFPETPSEKLKVRKAKAEGLLTPLAGKTPAQKEKILKRLAEASLPMPEGKTASEKQLIKKVRTAAGLPLERTPSEKLGKIKTKSRKVGAALSKQIATGIGGEGKSKAGIVEEFQDVLKTTTCDRGCGCDKKKIRFKHSYVTIRITSPDISSLCPCPDECMPGVKGGVITDNEGIKVTVGSAVGFPSFQNALDNVHGQTSYNSEISSLDESSPSSSPSITCDDRNTYKRIYLNTSFTNKCRSKANIHHCFNEIKTKSNVYETRNSTYLIECSESYSSSISESLISLKETIWNISRNPSMDSVEIVKTESSLSFLTDSSAGLGTISIISFNDSIISTSTRFLCYEYSTSVSETSLQVSECTNIINYSAVENIASESDENNSTTDIKSSPRKDMNKDVFNILSLPSQNEYDAANKPTTSRPSCRKPYDSQHKPIVVINDLNSDEDILKTVNEILAKKQITNASSIFVVVPTSDEYDTDLTSSASSTICINISDHIYHWKNSLIQGDLNSQVQALKNHSIEHGFKISAKRNKEGKNKNNELSTTLSKIQNKQRLRHKVETIFERNLKDRECQAEVGDVVSATSLCRCSFGMDTTQDRPCCCPPCNPTNDQRVANVFSELIKPIIVSQGVSQGLSQDPEFIYHGLNWKDHTPIWPPNLATSVSICSIPPCRGEHCHEPDNPMPIQKKSHMGQQSHQPNKAPCPYQCSDSNLKGQKNSVTISEPCKCIPGKIQTVKTVTHNVQSVGRRGPIKCKGKCNTNTRTRPRTPLSHLSNVLGAASSCSACGRPASKEKMQMRNACPCEAQLTAAKAAAAAAAAAPAQGQAIDHSNESLNVTNKKPCLCNDKDNKGKKNKKNKKKSDVICECPVVEEEPEAERYLLFRYVARV